MNHGLWVDTFWTFWMRSGNHENKLISNEWVNKPTRRNSMGTPWTSWTWGWWAWEFWASGFPSMRLTEKPARWIIDICRLSQDICSNKRSTLQLLEAAGWQPATIKVCCKSALALQINYSMKNRQQLWWHYNTTYFCTYKLCTIVCVYILFKCNLRMYYWCRFQMRTSKGLMISTVSQELVSSERILSTRHGGIFCWAPNGTFYKENLDCYFGWFVSLVTSNAKPQSMIAGHSLGTVIWKDKWGTRNFIMPRICFFVRFPRRLDTTREPYMCSSFFAFRPL